MKKVTLLYFAALRDLTGTAEEELELEPEVDTVAELLERVTRLHESLRNRMRQVRVAKNEEFVELTESLNDGDVVALIPPVQGG